jgi:hypothetical protein
MRFPLVETIDPEEIPESCSGGTIYADDVVDVSLMRWSRQVDAPKVKIVVEFKKIPLKIEGGASFYNFLKAFRPEVYADRAFGHIIERKTVSGNLFYFLDQLFRLKYEEGHEAGYYRMQNDFKYLLGRCPPPPSE